MFESLESRSLMSATLAPSDFAAAGIESEPVMHVAGIASPITQGVVGSAESVDAAASDGTQSESRTYSPVSNIMKTKHDTVKNSISNVR